MTVLANSPKQSKYNYKYIANNPYLHGGSVVEERLTILGK